MIADRRPQSDIAEYARAKDGLDREQRGQLGLRQSTASRIEIGDAIQLDVEDRQCAGRGSRHPDGIEEFAGSFPFFSERTHHETLVRAAKNAVFVRIDHAGDIVGDQGDVVILAEGRGNLRSRGQLKRTTSQLQSAGIPLAATGGGQYEAPDNHAQTRAMGLSAGPTSPHGARSLCPGQQCSANAPCRSWAMAGADRPSIWKRSSMKTTSPSLSSAIEGDEGG